MSMVIHFPLIRAIVVNDLINSQALVDSLVLLLQILLLVVVVVILVPLLLLLLLQLVVLVLLIMVMLLLLMLILMMMLLLKQRIASVGVLPLHNATLLFSSVHAWHLDTTD